MEQRWKIYDKLNKENGVIICVKYNIKENVERIG